MYFGFTGENVNVLERDKRLRPERPKKENPDFDYEFPENLVWVNKDQIPLPLTQKDTVRIEKLQEKQISQISQVWDITVSILNFCIANQYKFMFHLIKITFLSWIFPFCCLLPGNMKKHGFFFWQCKNCYFGCVHTVLHKNFGSYKLVWWSF